MWAAKGPVWLGRTLLPRRCWDPEKEFSGCNILGVKPDGMRGGTQPHEALHLPSCGCTAVSVSQGVCLPPSSWAEQSPKDILPGLRASISTPSPVSFGVPSAGLKIPLPLGHLYLHRYLNMRPNTGKINTFFLLPEDH